jgi:hypothetical protein
MKIAGALARAPFGTGSKSEHDAVWLEADGGERYVLRRAGANAFQDPVLEQLVGQRVIYHGNISGYTPLAESIAPAD